MVTKMLRRFFYEKVTKPPSLRNVKSVCYLNAALQAISSCQIFVDEILKLNDKTNSDINNLAKFCELIVSLIPGQVAIMDISQNAIFRRWNRPGEQDSFELLAFIINEVYNEVRSFNEIKGYIPSRDLGEWLKIDLPMRIIIKYEIQCKCEDVFHVALQSDLALHVPIAVKENNLQKLVDNFFSHDHIESYICNSCKSNNTTATKYTKLVRPLPNTICVHLQRTSWNGKKMSKIMKKIEFSKDLLIKSEFISMNDRDKSILQRVISGSEEVEHSEDNMARTSVNNQETIKLASPMLTNQDELFLLKSVIVHHGSISGGHYICFKLVDDKWFCTDDSRVFEVPESDMLRCTAYILFYEKS